MHQLKPKARNKHFRLLHTHWQTNRIGKIRHIAFVVEDLYDMATMLGDIVEAFLLSWIK